MGPWQAMCSYAAKQIIHNEPAGLYRRNRQTCPPPKPPALQNAAVSRGAGTCIYGVLLQDTRAALSVLAGIPHPRNPAIVNIPLFSTEIPTGCSFHPVCTDD